MEEYICYQTSDLPYPGAQHPVPGVLARALVEGDPAALVEGDLAPASQQVGC